MPAQKGRDVPPVFESRFVAQVTDPVAEHGEGPVWFGAEQVLCWVDMLRGDVLRWSPDSGSIHRWHVGTVAAALRPRVGGGAVLALERGFAVARSLSADVELLPPVIEDPRVRMNEGGCAPDGSFYAGSMAYDAAPGGGRLYRLLPDRSVDVVLEGVGVSNGLAWSPDGSKAYYVDSLTQRIDVFDNDPDSGLTHRRPFAQIPPDAGMPDGLTVDEEGAVWVALWGGGAVRRYRPDGHLDGVVELPVSQVTACAFGGPDLDQLYITTSRFGLAEGEQPAAGALFRTRPGVRGLPVDSYAG